MTSQKLYSLAEVPSQAGRTFMVTGANAGIGFETAAALASRGARVLLGCRSSTRGEAACKRIRERIADADLRLVPLDLGDLASVSKAAELVLEEPRLDCLINNAGIAATTRALTKDGFESHFGINHLGHFALVAHLIQKLEASKNARIVAVGSHAHRRAAMNWADLHAERSYSGFARYAMSKLANLLFTFELERRLRASNAHTISLACHPGGVWTELGRDIPQIVRTLVRPLAMLVVNTLEDGALPTLRAATDPSAKGGDYFGPGGMLEIAGAPILRRTGANAHSETEAQKLWEVSAELTGVQPVWT